MLGQHWPEKHSAKSFFRSGETPSPRRTLIDKNNDGDMHSLGAPTHPM